MSTLANKLAIITGSTSGIGFGIATEFARRGAQIVLNSFSNQPEDHETAKQLEDEFGVPVRYICADMKCPDQCRRLVHEAGEASILVNNAGIQHIAPVQDFPTEKWNLIVAVNLSAAFHTTAAALPAMRRNGWGRIVNIASAHGLTASPYKSAYISAKHGLIGLTKTVALETAEEPVTCNAVCPGYVSTALVEKQIPSQMEAHGMKREQVIREIMLARQPSRKFATISQVAETTVFLCSPSADQITGTTISIDGGWTAL